MIFVSGAVLPLAHETFWLPGPGFVFLRLRRTMLLCSLHLVGSIILRPFHHQPIPFSSILSNLIYRRSRRLEKVRPSTWRGGEEEEANKRSRMWTHEDELDREMGGELTQPLSVPT